MKKINRLLINICSSNLPKSKAFYTTLFDFKVEFYSDWFIQLVSQDQGLELGIIDAKNEIVPKMAQGSTSGFYITLVVDNADDIFNLAKEHQFIVLQEPKDTSYGQRRLVIQDPDGTVVDVSSPIVGFQF